MSDRRKPSSNQSYRLLQNQLNRREYLAAASGVASGVTILAGCIEGDDSDGGGDDSDSVDSDSTSDDDGDGEVNGTDLPTMSRLGEENLPEDMNVNAFAQETPGTHTMDICHDLFATRVYKDEVILRALDDWNWDPDSSVLTKTLRDDIVFWNGDQFTAEDMWSYDEINRLVAPDASPFESIEVVDDLTVEWTLKEAPNSVLVRNTRIPGQTFYYNIEIWREWIEQLKDVSNEDERDDIFQSLTEHSISLEEWTEGRGGTGVFEMVDWTETEIFYEQVGHGEHRYSDDIDVERFKMYVTPYGSARADQLFVDGEIDVHTSALDEQYVGEVPDYIQNVMLQEQMFCYQMLINQRNHEALQDYNVRRAMACVINTENVVINFGETRSNPIQVHTGMDITSTEEYWGDEMDQLLDYSPQESDHDQADYYLEQSGYSREDGTIYNSDGDAIEDITYIIVQDHLFTVPSETAAAQLEEYGFPVEFNAVPRDQWSTTINDNMGEWDLSMTSHYADADKHASSFFMDYSFGYQLTPPHVDINEWIDEEERSPWSGREFKPEIPMEVGQEDLSGETKEVDVHRFVQESRKTEDKERIDELIRDLSHMWNFHVPNIDVLYLVNGYVGNTRDYDWPEEEELKRYQPNVPYRVIHDGQVTYSDEVRSG